MKTCIQVGPRQAKPKTVYKPSLQAMQDSVTRRANKVSLPENNNEGHQEIENQVESL